MHFLAVLILSVLRLAVADTDIDLWVPQGSVSGGVSELNNGSALLDDPFDSFGLEKRQSRCPPGTGLCNCMFLSFVMVANGRLWAVLSQSFRCVLRRRDLHCKVSS